MLLLQLMLWKCCRSTDKSKTVDFEQIEQIDFFQINVLRIFGCGLSCGNAAEENLQHFHTV